MSGTDLPKISDEDVELVAQALWDETRKAFAHINDMPERPTRPCYSDARAVLEALVASGYRRVSGRRADGEPLPPTCCGGWIGEHGEGPILCDPCPPLPVADLPKISDEMLTAFFEGQDQWKREHGDIGSQEDARNYFRAGLAAALVASGYRREADVLREAYLAIRGHAAAYRAVPALEKLREAYEAGGRRDPEIRRQMAVHQWYARGLEAAARDIAERLGVPEHEIEEATALEQAQPIPVADGREVDVRITPAVSRTFAAPVTFYEPDEPVADVRAAFEMGEKGVTKPPAGAPQCTCPLIDTSSAPMKPEFVRGDPAGCKVHGQERDAEIEAAKRRARG